MGSLSTSGWCFSKPDRHDLSEQVIEEESSNLGNSPTTEKLQMELKTAVACCVSLYDKGLDKVHDRRAPQE